jgi:DnaJ-class molecular chaperone
MSLRGLHLESLRLALVGPLQECPGCWGTGFVGPKGEHYPMRDERPCPGCGGSGTTATPGVRAA